MTNFLSPKIGRIQLQSILKEIDYYRNFLNENSKNSFINAVVDYDIELYELRSKNLELNPFDRLKLYHSKLKQYYNII